MKNLRPQLVFALSPASSKGQENAINRLKMRSIHTRKVGILGDVDDVRWSTSPSEKFWGWKDKNVP